MIAAVDDTVLTHEVEYIAATNYVNKNLILYYLVFICTSELSLPAHGVAARRIGAMRGTIGVSQKVQDDTLPDVGRQRSFEKVTLTWPL
jgi:hypothetical protein